MSFEQFFHLKDSPFRLTPDPVYFFPSGAHKEALDTMAYSIRSGEGFIMITGTPGVGKTLLVRTLLRELGDTVNLALVLNPTITPRELLWVILDDLGHFDMRQHEGQPKEKLLRRFKDYLMEKSSQGIKTIIIIDEAQNLPKDTLEELRMLSNLETDRDKLIQIILVGQLELEERLKYDELKQLAQRISIRYRLTPLTREETGAYVRHRLEVAGDGRSIRFMPRVLSRIHDLSQGIPRRINLICERGLMAAYVDGETQVSRKHLVRAIRSIEGEGDRISATPVWLWPAIGCALLLIAAVWFAVSYKPQMALKSDITQPPAVTARKEVPVESLPVAKVEQEVVTATQSSPSVPDPTASASQSPALSPQSSGITPTPSAFSLQSQTAETPVLRHSPGERVEFLDEKKEAAKEPSALSTPQESTPRGGIKKNPAPSASDLQSSASSLQPVVLPIDEYYLAVDRDANLAQLWQGADSGPLLRHQFKLDWRIMEGLYILGNDKEKGAFIFNPTLFQWGGYKLLNASALWSQVSGFVKDSLIPVVVYSGDKLDRDLLTEEALFIRQTVDSWAASWRDRDLKGLMGFYGKTFSSYSIDSDLPQTYSRHELAEIRGRILATSSYITLLTSRPVCIIDPLNPDQAMAVFKQEYTSNTYTDQGIKVLYLRREGNYPEQPWKIVAKFFLPSAEG